MKGRKDGKHGQKKDEIGKKIADSTTFLGVLKNWYLLGPICFQTMGILFGEKIFVSK